jgi:hypothetical protein
MEALEQQKRMSRSLRPRKPFQFLRKKLVYQMLQKGPITHTTLNDRLAANSPELTPSISEDDPDFIGSLPMFRQRSGTSSGKGRRSLSHAASEPRAFPPSPRVSGEGSMELKNIHSSPGTTTIEEVPENTKDSKNPVVDAVTEAMKELWESKRSSQDHSDILVEMKYINRIRT